MRTCKGELPPPAPWRPYRTHAGTPIQTRRTSPAHLALSPLTQAAGDAAAAKPDPGMVARMARSLLPNTTQQWRTYNKRVPGGLALLLSISGSGFPRALPFGMVAGVSCAMLELYADIDGFNLFEHTYPFHVIAFITGFGLIFRLNIAYQRYWEARAALTTHHSPLAEP